MYQGRFITNTPAANINQNRGPSFTARSGFSQLQTNNGPRMRMSATGPFVSTPKPQAKVRINRIDWEVSEVKHRNPENNPSVTHSVNSPSRLSKRPMLSNPGMIDSNNAPRSADRCPKSRQPNP